MNIVEWCRYLIGLMLKEFPGFCWQYQNMQIMLLPLSVQRISHCYWMGRPRQPNTVDKRFLDPKKWSVCSEDARRQSCYNASLKHHLLDFAHHEGIYQAWLVVRSTLYRKHFRQSSSGTVVELTSKRIKIECKNSVLETVEKKWTGPFLMLSCKKWSFVTERVGFEKTKRLNGWGMGRGTFGTARSGLDRNNGGVKKLKIVWN